MVDFNSIKPNELAGIKAKDLLVRKEKSNKEIDYTRMLNFGDSIDENEAYLILTAIKNSNISDFNNLTKNDIKNIMKNLGLKGDFKDFEQYLKNLVKNSKEITSTTGENGETVTTTKYPDGTVEEVIISGEDEKTTITTTPEGKSTTRVAEKGKTVTTYDGYEKGEINSDIEDKFGQIKSKTMYKRSGNREFGASIENHHSSVITEYQTEEGWNVKITETYTGYGTQKLQNAEKKFYNSDGTIKTINYEGYDYRVYTETVTDQENKPISKFSKTPDGTLSYYTPINNKFMLSEIVSGNVVTSIQYSENYDTDGVSLETTKIDDQIREKVYYSGDGGEFKITYYDDNSIKETFSRNTKPDNEYVKKVITEEGEISYITYNNEKASRPQIDEFEAFKEDMMSKIE